MSLINLILLHVNNKGQDWYTYISLEVGNIKFLTLLFYFRLNANPAIADMKGYLPLHRAVLGNHEDVLDVFKENFPIAYVVIFCF